MSGGLTSAEPARWLKHGSGSKVTWVKVKGHVSQGQHKGHYIVRWAHVNVTLFHFKLCPTEMLLMSLVFGWSKLGQGGRNKAKGCNLPNVSSLGLSMVIQISKCGLN